MNTTSFVPEPPSRATLLADVPKAAKELMSLSHYKWRRQLQRVPEGDGHPIVTVPGFGGADGSMASLRRFLKRAGYDAHPWELGRNLVTQRVTTMDEILEFCAMREGELARRVEQIADRTGEKVSLIGWSMGGVYCNSLAQTHPELVRQVVTLGAPVGDPRGTSTWNILKKMNRSEVPEELQNVDGWLHRKNSQGERKVRTTILYSPNDGAVSRSAAVIENDKLVENIEVDSSHVGFSHNPLVYWVIADRLSQNPYDWQRFDLSMQPRKIQEHFNLL
ncbi:Uncharacterised protein [BD1-7 clade bacterium]|uniref:AB hydrolase-1 domain-containing protein n=1 Tax=BD1-7 clade bacterium TaxID=2029982 RepID=A0A5S9PLL5_9GAMM|nr:Uncharacterised protein [BD1-7 clade bacterium]CAA0105355.1 Uncharacterised protein [BD1-7 clade bacterium]